MKRLSRILGVTLLEIMLVLAVASLVIVMSIRYYQTTQTSLATQQLQRAVTAIIAFADSYGLSSGNYTNLAAADIWSALPKDMQGASPNIKTPWGDATLVLAPAADNYQVDLTMPPKAPTSICPQLAGFVSNVAYSHLAGDATCGGGKVTWKYYLAVQRT